MPFHTMRKSLELAIGNCPNMVGAPNSSSHPHGLQKGDWESCSVCSAHLNKLQTQGYLPPTDLVSVQAGLTSLNDEALAENFPNSSKEERVCFVSFLLRGVGFPIHPFIRGLLEYYGLQLHNLTPGPILHIAGSVALCELFLGCEAHFELWRKFFCLVATPKRDLYSRWAAPKYGALPGQDTYPALRRRHPKSGPWSGFILKTSFFRTQSGMAFPNSPVLL